ncbi:hypothetical protein [Methyloradius palustris]|uniref:Uncharacterized protein n=1 Tax=Methyloradius palustris TaxID=2778876 RepID=A0A8D5G9W8_9PROT|nr:hypothetical protein [Methyloradius palustris]BCM24316.1 hypothetical protein ZMTM_05750 [Methyloradius palustris]
MPPLAMVMAMLMLIFMMLVNHYLHFGLIAALFIVVAAVYVLLTLIVLYLYFRIGDWTLIYQLFRESFTQAWKEIEAYFRNPSK